MAAFCAFRECAKIFQQLWGLHRKNISSMRRDIIWEPQENKMQLKFSPVPQENITLVFSLRAKWVRSCPNSINIGATWKNLRSFLSILNRMQWAKNPSHATVPLKSFAGELMQWVMGKNSACKKNQDLKEKRYLLMVLATCPEPEAPKSMGVMLDW